jgi:YidC/Oxa1 family membrane protein insertase
MSFLWIEILYKPMLNALIMLYNTVAFGDMGIAIIELTIIIRLILLPSSIKALRSQITMQKLQPELEKIKQKYKDDKQKQSQVTMEFYKKYKINPLSSCLPTLIQLPFMIALFWILRDALSSNNLHMLYPFVAKPAQINTYFLGWVNLAASKNYVLAALAAITQFIQSKMIMPKSNPGEKGMQSMISTQMIYFMPILTFIIAITLPAGLALYWTVTTVFAIITQYFILRVDKDKKLIPIESSGNTQKKGFMAKLMEKYSTYPKALEEKKKENKGDKNDGK